MKNKKIAEMTFEEQEVQRAKWRENTQKSRDAKRPPHIPPDHDEAIEEFETQFPERVRELNEYALNFENKIIDELARPLGRPQRDSNQNVIGFDYDEQMTVSWVARCLLGLKRGWITKVQGGDEIVSGIFFADCCANVERANRFGLRKSPTFDAAYISLLTLVDKRYGEKPTNDSKIVKQELAGTYVLPPLPEPEPENVSEITLIVPKKSEVPTDSEILEQGLMRTFQLLQDSGLSQ